jgi:hypothetical protein
VAVLSIWRWVLLRLLRSPAVGVLCLLLLGSIVLLGKLQTLPSPAWAIEATLVWCHPAALLGVSLGLVSLSNGAPFLARVDPWTRFRGELGALLLAAVYLQLPILGGAWLEGVAPAELGRSLPAILTADLQLASAAVLLLIPELSSALRASLFLAAVVLVPALCASRPLLAPLAALLDAGAVLRRPDRAALLPALAAGVSLALAGYLLRTGPARAPAA